jgi:hypothetical protein
MPTIYRRRDWMIMMYPADHNPPHFHVVVRSGERATVEIATLQARGNVRAAVLREVLAWAQENRARLLREWERLQG